MRNNFVCRAARTKDRPRIVELIAGFPEDLEQDDLPNWNEFFVATLNRRVIACCALEENSLRNSEVRSLAVKFEFQGLGIGKTLVIMCEERARKKNIRFLTLMTDKVGFFSGLLTFNT